VVEVDHHTAQVALGEKEKGQMQVKDGEMLKFLRAMIDAALSNDEKERG
jgi:hypothetical protein